MSLAEDFVENFLAHYASQYYDPVKAHEYYLLNRQLSGQQSTSGLTIKGNKGRTEKRKEAWTYAKNQVTLAKKEDLKKAEEANKQALQQMRTTATERRTEIGGKLKDFLASLSDKKVVDAQSIEDEKSGKLDDLASKMKAKAEQINADAVKQIKALPPIPEGVSGQRRAFLSAQRDNKAARIRGTADTELKKVSDEGSTEANAIVADAKAKHAALATSTKEQQQSGRAGATTERATASFDLKATIEKARADYVARKENLKAEYEAKAQKEYDAIRQRV